MENISKFKQLSFEQRKVIEKSLKKGCLQKEMALALGVNKSTISREISTRSRDGVYWADLAQFNYSKNRQKCHPKLKINNDKIVSHFCDEIKNSLRIKFWKKGKT
jgi:IS30 family transposase